jgi:HNH endonuclease.
MADTADTAWPTCAQCGEPFKRRKGRGRPQRFCSPKCRERHHARAYKRIEQPFMPCSHCGRMFRRFNAQASLCSNACKVAAYKLRRGRVTQSMLVQREAAALKRIARRVPIALHRIQGLRAKIADIVARRSHCCSSCSAPLSGQHLGQRFCTDCMAHRLKGWKRAAKARRRAVERGRNAERFDPFEIFERDKWRCHLCGIKTPKRLRGTYEDNAPELDHVIPLAAGGEHSRRNTACACRKCNIEKADKPLGQLRLVA